MTDEDAWIKYPQHHKWFNKLWVAETMGYKCGPAGVDIIEKGKYVVRPIYNLDGMGIKARVVELEKGNPYNKVTAGEFWCEYLAGPHYSANYVWEPNHITGGQWRGISCWEGTNAPNDLSKFSTWKRSKYIPLIMTHMIPEFKKLHDVKNINVEWKSNKIIEVHLRHSDDPDYNTLIPVWSSDLGPKKAHYEKCGFDFISSYDNGNGQLEDPRIGFFVK